MSAMEQPQIQATPLLEEPLWVVGPANARFRRHKPITLQSLSGKPMIIPSGPRGIRTLVNHACTMANVELTIVAETNAMSIQKSLVLAGHGLTILPPIAFAQELADRRLTAAPLTEPRISRTIVVALPNNRPVGQHVRRTVELLVKCDRKSAAPGARSCLGCATLPGWRPGVRQTPPQPADSLTPAG